MTRTAVLRLYRDYVRTGRRWANVGERRWILEEAARLFRAHRDEADPERIGELLRAGEDRLAVAKHYQIPYERPEHFGGGGAEGLSGHKQKPIVSRGRKRVNVAGHTKWKDS